MRIEILGTRGNVAPSAPKHRRHAGILVDGTIMLDLGEPSYLRRRPQQILITHLHPDHAAFLVTKTAPRIPLYLPQRCVAAPDAHVITRPLRFGDYRIVPVPTIHAANTRSLGFVVQRGRERLFYSSDMIGIDRRYRPRLRSLDLVITDGSFKRRGGLVRVDPATGKRFGHAGIPELVELFSRFTRRIVFTHFGSWFYRDVAASVRWIASLSDGVEVMAAHDGMCLEVARAKVGR